MFEQSQSVKALSHFEPKANALTLCSHPLAFHKIGSADGGAAADASLAVNENALVFAQSLFDDVVRLFEMSQHVRLVGVFHIHMMNLKALRLRVRQDNTKCSAQRPVDLQIPLSKHRHTHLVGFVAASH